MIHTSMCQIAGGVTAWLPKSETDVDLTHQLERQRMVVWNWDISQTSVFFLPLLKNMWEIIRGRVGFLANTHGVYFLCEYGCGIKIDYT